MTELRENICLIITVMEDCEWLISKLFHNHKKYLGKALIGP